MKTIRSLASLSLLALVAFAGCQRVNPPLQGRGDPYMTPQVTFASTGLEGTIAYQQPVVQRDDAGNLLHVTLPIRNDQAKTITIDYRVTFYDRNGGTISQSGWRSKTLEANTPDTITVNSTTDRAADFNVSIRKAK